MVKKQKRKFIKNIHRKIKQYFARRKLPRMGLFIAEIKRKSLSEIY